MMSHLFWKFKGVALKPWNKFKSLSFKKKILVLGLIIIAFIVVSQVITNITKPSPFIIEKVERDDITEVVTESGNIITSGRTDVYSPTNGYVVETLVDNGTFVSEGDKLFVAKSSASDQEAKAAQSNYLAAVAGLNAAQATANTLRAQMYTEWESYTDMATNTTYEDGDKPNEENRKAAEFQVAQDEWLAAEKRYKDQETAIAQANAAVSSTHALYLATQDATVTAPVDGTVTNLAITNGSSVAIKSVSLTGSATPPVLILLSDYESEILTLLSEDDIAKVKPNQNVEIKVNAIDNKTYNGIVKRVDAVGTNNQGVINYNAYVSFTDADENIKQGMTVDVDIKTLELTDVLSVSNSAVKPYQGGRAVRVVDKNKPEGFSYIPVKIGVKGVEKTQILEGVVEGQEVISSISNENIKRPGLFGG